MKRTEFPIEAEVSIPKKKLKRDQNKDPSASPHPPSLEAFLANFFFSASIQEDPAVVRIAYKNVSPKLITVYLYPLLCPPHIPNTRQRRRYPRNFNQDLNFSLNLHNTFSNLVILSDSFVVSPSDTEGKPGEIAQILSLGGIQNGAPVHVALVEVVKIVVGPKGNRLIERIDNVFTARPAGLPLPPTLAETALQHFFGAAFFGMFIQDDDEIFELICKKSYSPKVV
jgi:hypothetical protein